MRDFLERCNYKLIRDVETLFRLLDEAPPPDELQEYRKVILDLCEAAKRLTEQILSRLQLLKHADILEDLVSETQIAMQLVRRLSAVYAIPILRASDSDRLSLRMILWLHQAHRQTVNYFPAFRDGHWSVLPFPHIPIYSLPSIEQCGLLYQPLSFHEFGHVLYACHQPELDILVGDLQAEILELLSPDMQRNDPFSRRQAQQRQVVADTWYRWIQELFCDAVGFTIGGPCFLHAFSSTLSTLHPGTLYQYPEELKYSAHPVGWLRVQFLTKRAEGAGFVALAGHLEKQWCEMSEAMGIVEDYHGFYDGVLESAITSAIEDMITEAGPRCHSQREAAGGGWIAGSVSPVRLLNWAWQVFLKNPEEYRQWETQQIGVFLQTKEASPTL